MLNCPTFASKYAPLNCTHPIESFWFSTHSLGQNSMQEWYNLSRKYTGSSGPKCSDDVQIANEYMNEIHRWVMAVKVMLPLTGTIAFLFDAEQADWFQSQLQKLITSLQAVGAEHGFDVIAAWKRSLDSTPIPIILVEEFSQFTRPDALRGLKLQLPPQIAATELKEVA